jgi:integrase
MPAVKLSQNFISNLKPAKKRVSYSDTSNRYLMYRQGLNSGAFYHVRKIDGKLRYIKLDAVTYADAVRENARLTSGAVDVPAATDTDTLAAIHDTFMKFKETRGDSAKCIFNARQRFRDYVPEKLKNSSDVQTSDLEAVAQKLGKLGKCRTANMLIKEIAAAFNYRNKVQNKSGNPAINVSKFKEQSRDRYLSQSEIGQLFAVLPEMSTDFQDFFKIALFTGKRKSNVLAMRWDCLDRDRGEYMFPAAENKSRTADVTVLVPEVLEILDRRKQSSVSPWVFPRYGRPGEHIVQMNKSFENFCKKAGIQNLHQHDLRRTIGSIMAQNGESLHTIAAVLGQTSIGATHIYARLNSAAKSKAINNAVSTICNFQTDNRKKLETLLQTLSPEKIGKIYLFAKNL